MEGSTVYSSGKRAGGLVDYTDSMELDSKSLFGIAAAIVAIINYAPYLLGVVQKTLFPHAFSWIIFTIITATISVAQFTGGAGPGAWATGATSLITACIALLALRNGGYRITRFDYFSLGGALVAIPVWVATSNPLWAVLILTVVEILGFLPTYRKAYWQPFDESKLAFSLTIIKYLLAFGAMQVYTVTTLLFPLVVMTLSTLLLLELIWRSSIVLRGRTARD